MRITIGLLFGLAPASAFVMKPNGASFVSTPVASKASSSEMNLFRRKKSTSTVELIEAMEAATVDEPGFPLAGSVFPGAKKNSELCNFISETLANHGYKEDNTLIATSLCCDEVNRPLESDLSKMYDTNFNMGGLAGFPFGGATSFGAMASHIPDGGSCVVVYGPHVGVDSQGNVGTVERRGRASGGACCGSAVAASNYVAGVSSGKQKEAAVPEQALDAQQYFVGKMLMPHAARLDNADEKMKELPFALYDAQTEMMTDIIGTSASAVADGTIAVLGGIQINTPPGFSDYYLPLSFELYNNKGELIDNLLPKSNRPFAKVQDVFPDALSNDDLTRMVTSVLAKEGYNKKNSLVATSLCCDEVNRPLELDLADCYDYNFNMGGLAGFPMGGATSFGAMASHIPDGGSCVVVYGPHVGVDSTGAAGTVERRGRANGGACCGSAVAASNYVAGVSKGDKKATVPDDALDAQQYFVGSMLLPHAARLDKAKDKMVELPHALYDAQTDLMERIVGKSCGAVADGTIAVLGGIQINTPPGFTDYYLPLKFGLYDNKGDLMKDLLPAGKKEAAKAPVVEEKKEEESFSFFSWKK